MILTAQMASLYRLAIDRRPTPDDDRPQPVLASTTLRSGLPEVFPQREQQASDNSRRLPDDPPDEGEATYNRRQSDQPADADKQQHDRRRQALPTLIDTRLTRRRRRSDRQETIDFEI